MVNLFLKVDVSSKPSDRHFRNAWTLSGTVISEDLATAKTMFKDKIREVRKPLLEAQDVAYMKALESGSSSAQTTVKNEKTKLRDATDAVQLQTQKQSQNSKELRGIQTY